MSTRDYFHSKRQQQQSPAEGALMASRSPGAASTALRSSAIVLDETPPPQPEAFATPPSCISSTDLTLAGLRKELYGDSSNGNGLGSSAGKGATASSSVGVASGAAHQSSPTPQQAASFTPVASGSHPLSVNVRRMTLLASPANNVQFQHQFNVVAAAAAASVSAASGGGGGSSPSGGGKGVGAAINPLPAFEAVVGAGAFNVRRASLAAASAAAAAGEGGLSYDAASAAGGGGNSPLRPSTIVSGRSGGGVNNNSFPSAPSSSMQQQQQQSQRYVGNGGAGNSVRFNLDSFKAFGSASPPTASTVGGGGDFSAEAKRRTLADSVSVEDGPFGPPPHMPSPRQRDSSPNPFYNGGGGGLYGAPHPHGARPSASPFSAFHNQPSHSPFHSPLLSGPSAAPTMSLFAGGLGANGSLINRDTQQSLVTLKAVGQLLQQQGQGQGQGAGLPLLPQGSPAQQQLQLSPSVGAAVVTSAVIEPTATGASAPNDSPPLLLLATPQKQLATSSGATTSAISSALIQQQQAPVAAAGDMVVNLANTLQRQMEEHLVGFYGYVRAQHEAERRRYGWGPLDTRRWRAEDGAWVEGEQHGDDDALGCDSGNAHATSPTEAKFQRAAGAQRPQPPRALSLSQRPHQHHATTHSSHSFAAGAATATVGANGITNSSNSGGFAPTAEAALASFLYLQLEAALHLTGATRGAIYLTDGGAAARRARGHLRSGGGGDHEEEGEEEEGAYNGNGKATVGAGGLASAAFARRVIFIGPSSARIYDPTWVEGLSADDSPSSHHARNSRNGAFTKKTAASFAPATISLELPSDVPLAAPSTIATCIHHNVGVNISNASYKVAAMGSSAFSPTAFVTASSASGGGGGPNANTHKTIGGASSVGGEQHLSSLSAFDATMARSHAQRQLNVLDALVVPFGDGSGSRSVVGCVIVADRQRQQQQHGGTRRGSNAAADAEDSSASAAADGVRRSRGAAGSRLEVPFCSTRRDVTSADNSGFDATDEQCVASLCTLLEAVVGRYGPAALLGAGRRAAPPLSPSSSSATGRHTTKPATGPNRNGGNPSAAAFAASMARLSRQLAAASLFPPIHQPGATLLVGEDTSAAAVRSNKPAKKGIIIPSPPSQQQQQKRANTTTMNKGGAKGPFSSSSATAAASANPMALSTDTDDLDALERQLDGLVLRGGDRGEEGVGRDADSDAAEEGGGSSADDSPSAETSRGRKLAVGDGANNDGDAAASAAAASLLRSANPPKALRRTVMLRVKGAAGGLAAALSNGFRTNRSGGGRQRGEVGGDTDDEDFFDGEGGGSSVFGGGGFRGGGGDTFQQTAAARGAVSGGVGGDETLLVDKDVLASLENWRRKNTRYTTNNNNSSRPLTGTGGFVSASSSAFVSSATASAPTPPTAGRRRASVAVSGDNGGPDVGTAAVVSLGRSAIAARDRQSAATDSPRDDGRGDGVDSPTATAAQSGEHAMLWAARRRQREADALNAKEIMGRLTDSSTKATGTTSSSNLQQQQQQQRRASVGASGAAPAALANTFPIHVVSKEAFIGEVGELMSSVEVLWLRSLEKITSLQQELGAYDGRLAAKDATIQGLELETRRLHRQFAALRADVAKIKKAVPQHLSERFGIAGAASSSPPSVPAIAEGKGAAVNTFVATSGGGSSTPRRIEYRQR